MPSPPASLPEPGGRDGRRRWLIAAGTARYDSLEQEDWLPSVAEDLEQIVGLFCGRLGYQRVLAEVSFNPTRAALHAAMSDWLTSQERSAEDVVVVYYSGHGLTRGGRHYLLTRDYSERNPAGTALATEELVWMLGEDSPVRDLLVMVDTCYAGSGALDMGRVAAEVSGLRAPATVPGAGWWFLTAARPTDEAAQGAFAAALTQAIGHPRAGALPPYVPLEELVKQVNAIFGRRGLAQQAQIGTAQSSGVPPFIVNPGYVPGAPDEAALPFLRRQTLAPERDVTEHWDPRARGVATASDPGWYFSGRTRVLRDLVTWLRDPDADHKARVVTGGPGSGKSAVLGRLVTLADPRLRAAEVVAGAPAGTVPPEGAVSVAIYARNRPIDDLVALLADGLEVAAGTPAELVAALAARPRRRAVVIDALDEAIEPGTVARKLVTPLLEVASRAELKLVLGTRRPLLDALGPRIRLLDLDDPAYLELSDLAGYVTRMLLADHEPDVVTPFRARPELAGQVGWAVARRANPTFLIARIAADNLRSADELPDVTAPGWDVSLPASVGDAFDAYLERFGGDEQRARDLLTPLAFARGSGLPWEQLWAPLASALADGRRYTDEDIRWLHEAGGAYLTEARDHDRSVYRLYHQALAEHLREHCQDPEAAQRHIVRTLLDLVPANGQGSRDWLAAHPYILTNLASHAAAAGLLDDLLADPVFPLAADVDRLLPALASAREPAGLTVADVYRAAVHHMRGRPAGEAAAYFELTARQFGHDALADRVAASAAGLPGGAPWTVPWVRWAASSPSRLIGAHDDEVSALALSVRNGAPIAVTGSRDGTLRLWDLARGVPLGPPLDGHAGGVTALAAARVNGGPVAVTGGADHMIRIWDLSSGAQVGPPLAGHTGPVEAIAVSEAAGGPIAVTVSGGTACVWDLAREGSPATRAEVAEARPRSVLRAGGGRRSRPGSVAALAAGQLAGRPVAVIASSDGAVRIWDLESGQPAGSLPSGDGADLPRGTRRDVNAIALGELDGRTVVVMARTLGPDTVGVRYVESRLQVWDLGRAELIAGPDVMQGGTQILATGRLNDQVIALSADRAVGSANAVDVWDLSRQTRLGRLAGHTSKVQSVAVGELDGQLIAVSASADHTVRSWDLTRITPVQAGEQGEEPTVAAVAAGEADGTPVVVTGGFQTARILDERDGTEIAALAGHFDWVEGVAVSEILKLGYEDADFSDLDEPAEVRPAVVTASRDGTVRIWDARGFQVDTWTPFQPMGFPPAGGVVFVDDWIKCVAVCQLSGRPLVVIGTSDPIVLGWLIAPSWFMPTVLGLRGHTDEVTAVALGELEGQPVAVTGSRDKTVRVWDLDKGVPVGDPLTGHADGVRAVAVGTLDEQPVAVTGGLDKTVRVWDLTSGQPLGPLLTGHAAAVNAVAIGQVNGETTIVSGSLDGTLRLWDVRNAAATVISLDTPVQALTIAPSGRLLVGASAGILALDLNRADGRPGRWSSRVLPIRCPDTLKPRRYVRAGSITRPGPVSRDRARPQPRDALRRCSESWTAWSQPPPFGRGPGLHWPLLAPARRPAPPARRPGRCPRRPASRGGGRS
jgi:WD40 repeat protein